MWKGCVREYMYACDKVEVSICVYMGKDGVNEVESCDVCRVRAM